MKQTTEDYYEGKGCKCYAWSQGECACGADWTPKEVYRLRDEIVSLREQLGELNNEYLILYELASEVWPITNRPLSIVLSEREQAEAL